MIPADESQVDVDAPIPYVLTDRARRELAADRERVELELCPHEWKYERSRGIPVCQNCGVAVDRPAESIPSYVQPRRRR